MGSKHRNRRNEQDIDLLDPLGLEGEQNRKPQLAPKKQGKRRRVRRSRLVRVEQIRKYMDEAQDIDPEAVITMYLPHRRLRRFGAALLRLNKLYLLLLGLLLVVAILFIMSFTQEKMGNFTINLNRLEMFRKGISIDTDPNFRSATSRLTADSVVDASNISVYDLPGDLDEQEGSHNGRHYMAYTYYLRNAGKEDVAYDAEVHLESSTKGAEEAVRVAVWRNGERTIYAVPSADGTPEDGCVNFVDGDTACVYHEPEFLVGNVDRYTVVIWLEGDDPECVDQIVGGSLQFRMVINADYEDETNLLYKFIQDVVDTLTGNKPIFGSSDSHLPSYMDDQEVTWENRRNQ